MTELLILPYASDYPASREYCRRVTREQAKNFYYGLRLLPEPAKSSMFALYAWMRRADDLADDSTDLPLVQRRALLDQFRELTHQALSDPTAASTQITDWRGWPAFADCAHRHQIPAHLFDDMINGQMQDLDFHQPQNDADLREYCYRVAGVVGVASIHIWGFTAGAQTESLAVDRGIAFQLTNILRDVREDAGRQRIYFPADQMKRFGVTEEELMAGRKSPGFQALMQYHIDIAEQLFCLSAPLDQRIKAENRCALSAMTAIYHGILHKVSQNPRGVLEGRVRLSKWTKTWIALKAWRLSRRNAGSRNTPA